MMSKLLSKTLIACLAALMITVAMPQPVVAQPQGEIMIEPPRPRGAPTAPILWSYAAVVLILGAVFAANTIPSKRGHQD